MRKTFFRLLVTGSLAFALGSCVNPKNSEFSATTSLIKDKAAYLPGEKVNFTTDHVSPDLEVRYYHLGKLISKDKLSGTAWSWAPPKDDYKGYYVTLWDTKNQQPVSSTAVDVSSDWSRFPRYGFLSEYGEISEKKEDSVISNLKNHHINGLQFYDWHYKHHQPLAGTSEKPWDEWTDIAKRRILKKTVADYISLAHQYNMKAMFYNLNYGILKGYDKNQLPDSVFMYKDPNHQEIDVFKLPEEAFISDIYFTDPANKTWQNFLIGQNNEVYKVFGFDGFHIDQVGDRGKVYRYDGTDADLPNAFPKFISAMKKARPDKRLLFNAVNQYGQEEMANSELDFLYTEVWEPNDGFKELAQVLLDNSRFSGGKKNTVLAAYMDYNKANNKGEFNTPGVLLADAVIFAFGGSHLELGEHMLGKEYFPNNNLKMKPDLQEGLADYYNFLVAYENLLRDGGTFQSAAVRSENPEFKINAWPPVQGQIATVSKNVENRQVVHFINFTKANSLEWRDKDGTQAEPGVISKLSVAVNSAKPVSKVWYASPDLAKGAPQELKFSQTQNTVTVTLPDFKYWGMLVLE